MIFRMSYGRKLRTLMMTLESYCHMCVCCFIYGGRSWKKTVRNSDAEDILIETGKCKQGTASKGFASAGDYYQSMREHKLLQEAMANLHTDAFEQWHLERNDAQLSGLVDDLQNTCDILCNT